MSHELSETVERNGRFYNVLGRDGRPIKPVYRFERPSYPDLKSAVSAAKRRSGELVLAENLRRPKTIRGGD